MRKHYLDNLRWGTVLLVILYHVIYLYNGVLTSGVVGPFSPRQPQDAYMYLVYPWFMALLFLVAGASARCSLQKMTVRQFAARRTRRLLVPSTIGLFAFQWVQGWVNMQLAGAFATMPATTPGPVLFCIMAVSGTGVLWFIQLLWLYSLLLIPVYLWDKDRLYRRCAGVTVPVLVLLALPVWAAAQVLNLPVIAVYRCGIYGLCFFLGYFVFSQEAVLARLRRFWAVFSGFALCLGILSLYVYWGQNYAVAPVVNSPLSIAVCWAGCLAAFALALRFGDRANAFTRWMTAHSFGLYVFHYLPASATALWLHTHTTLPALPCYLLTGFASVAGALALYALIRRIPVLRWCVLGIRKKEVSRVL